MKIGYNKAQKITILMYIPIKHMIYINYLALKLKFGTNWGHYSDFYADIQYN
jgi:hypothetical protein